MQRRNRVFSAERTSALALKSNSNAQLRTAMLAAGTWLFLNCLLRRLPYGDGGGQRGLLLLLQRLQLLRRVFSVVRRGRPFDPLVADRAEVLHRWVSEKPASSYT